ncbi:MAG: acyl-CoA thioesterase [Reichenbachiella sp.]
MFEFDSSKKYLKTTKSRSVIRFQDCDPLQHLNNAKYFDYYFNGRDDQVPQLYGVQNTDIYRAFDAVWVVYSHQTSYLRPAGMGEWVKLYSRIIWHDEGSVLIEYFMVDDDETYLKNILWTKLKFVNRKGKSQNHPEQLMQFLGAVSFDEFKGGEIDFDLRLKQVKEEVSSQEIKVY